MPSTFQTCEAELQQLFTSIQQSAIDSEGQPVTPDEIPGVATLLLRRWMSSPLFQEQIEECLDDLRFQIL